MQARRQTILLLAMIALFVAGCGSQQQRRFRQEKRQFSIVMQSKLRQFEKRTRELAVQLEGDSLRAAEVKELQDNRNAFATEVGGIGAATENEWKEMKPAMEAGYYDLERRYYEIVGAVAEEAAMQAAADTLDSGTETTDAADSTAAKTKRAK